MDARAFAPFLAQTIHACLDSRADGVQSVELPFPHTGFSGSRLRLFGVDYRAEDGARRTTRLLVKEAGLIERHASVLLSRQGHAALPFAYAADLSANAQAPLCIEYIQPDANLALDFSRRAARALADIHFRNLGSRALLEWTPPADSSYFNSGYVLETWRQSWQEHMAEASFAAEYGMRQSELEAAAVEFLEEMEALWREGATLTLIHGDLHHGNALARDSQPYFIDWAHAHFGTFYLDLPNLFTLAEADAYRERLSQLGFSISESEFQSRYRQAARHVGFKYMAFVMSGWAGRDEPGSQVRAHLDNLIHLAVHGN